MVPPSLEGCWRESAHTRLRRRLCGYVHPLWRLKVSQQPCRFVSENFHKSFYQYHCPTPKLTLALDALQTLVEGGLRLQLCISMDALIASY